MSEYYEEAHDVAVALYTEIDNPWAEVRAYAFPDGSPKNQLDVDELREVASMLEDAADRLEKAKK